MKTIFAVILFVKTCQASLKIINPPVLAKEFGEDGLIKSSLANFGHITYG